MNSQRSVVVHLKANVADFKRQIDSGAQSLDQLAAKGDKTGKASETAMGRLVQSAQLQREAWTTAGSALLGVGTAITGVGVAALATGISYNTLQQTSRAALTTITGGAEQANAQMDKLDAFATTSPFAKDVFIRAQQQMLGFGIEAEKVIPYLDSIQQSVAATGGSNQDIAELSGIFSRISASAKITAEDLNQFGQRGIDAATLIGSQMGMTGAEIRDSITKGTLDAGEALDALSAGMQENFGGAADNVKNTIAGAFDRVKAAWRDLSSELAAPLVGPEGGGLLVGLLNTTADLMRAFQDLPGPIKGAATALGGVAGVGALAGGAFLLLAPRVFDTMRAFSDLRETWSSIVQQYPRVAGALRSVSGPLGRLAAAGTTLGVAGVALGAISHAVNDSGTARSADRIATEFERLAAAGRELQGFRLDDLFLDMPSWLGMSTMEADSLGEAIDRVLNPSTTDRLSGLFGSVLPSYMNDYEESVRLADEALTSMLQAGGTESSAALVLIEGLGLSSEDLARVLPGVAVELDNLEGAADGAADATGELAAEEERLAEVTATTTDEIWEQISGLQTLYDLMREAGDGFLSLQDAQAGWAEELMGLGDTMESFADATGEALNDAGDNWDFFSEKGALANEAVNSLAREGLGLIDVMRENGATSAELEGQMETTRQEVIDLAEAFGMGAPEAEALADAMGLIPDNITPVIDIQDEDALETIAEITDTINALPDGEITLNGDPMPAEDALAEVVEAINTAEVDEVAINGRAVPIDDALAEIDRQINERGATFLEFDLDVDSISTSVMNANALLADTPANLGIVADPKPFEDAIEPLRQGVSGGDPARVMVDADTLPADIRLNDWWVAAEDTTGTPTLEADTIAAWSGMQVWEDYANNATATSGIDAEDRGASDFLGRTLSMIDKGTGTAGIDGEDRGARAETNRTTGWIGRQRGNVGIGGSIDWGSINGAVATIRNRVSGASMQVSVGAAIGAGFADGGYTGDGPKYEPAGIVHRAEWVTTKERTAKYRPLLEAIHEDRVPGYAHDGFVGAMSYQPSPTYISPSSQTTNVTNNVRISADTWDGIEAIRDLMDNGARLVRQRDGVRG